MCGSPSKDLQKGKDIKHTFLNCKFYKNHDTNPSTYMRLSFVNQNDCLFHKLTLLRQFSATDLLEREEISKFLTIKWKS